MSWNSGRILESIIDGETVISYRYNKDGIRIEKTMNDEETEYLLDENNKMMGEKCGEDILWYLYDSGDEISGFEWNGIDYYYVKNRVGDVEGIADKDGNIRCKYYYDVWGKLTGIEGDKELGKRNSIRYRGYYYDEETGLYYLNTRYYDPEVKRFLNRDMLDNETNLYQYCYNNPVLNADVDGMGPTDCADSNVVMIKDPFGSSYSYEEDIAVPGTGMVPTYRLNNTKIYFNCYMWAIYKYNFTYSFYAPGYLTKVQWNADMPVERVAKLVTLDLQKLHYSILSCTTYMASINASNVKRIALKINSTDYHFMTGTSYRGGSWWTFKAGAAGPVLRIANGLGPNSIDWMHYVYKNDKWCSQNPRYTSAPYYIAYK